MTTPTAWAHLPNARHIDAVLADLKARPGVWAETGAAAGGTASFIARWVIQITSIFTGRHAEHYAAAAAVAVGSEAVTFGAREAARRVIEALIIWDSSADLLDLSPDALRTLIDVAAPPVCHQAALLLPWAIVREQQP